MTMRRRTMTTTTRQERERETHGRCSYTHAVAQVVLAGLERKALYDGGAREWRGSAAEGLVGLRQVREAGAVPDADDDHDV
jgi:hypothetical protein